MLHVGMNIDEKLALRGKVAGLLRPGLVRNLIRNVSADLAAPVDLIARKPDAICR